jgi:hypothetical protein
VQKNKKEVRRGVVKKSIEFTINFGWLSVVEQAQGWCFFGCSNDSLRSR